MRLIDETEYQEKLAKIPMEVRTFRKAVEVAEDMPTIDAVPVVRCKECFGRSCWEKDDNGCDICWVSGMYVRGEDDFCSYGEMEEGSE